MQLLIIALTMPWLIMLARTPVSTPVWVMGGTVAAVAAIGWLGERLDFSSPLSAFANGLSPYGPWVIIGLAGLAGVALVLQRTKRRPSSPSS